MHALPVHALLAVASISLWPTWTTLARVWYESSEYSHGWLVAAIAAVWVFIRTGDLPAYSARWSPLAFVALLACLLAWLVAYRAVSDIGQQLMLPPILCLAVWMACGRPIAVRLAPAIFFLFFAIPIWDLLAPYLQQLTVWITRTSLGAMGISVSIEGVNVTIPEGRFRVAEGCSGKNFLLVSLGLAALLAGMEGLTRRRSIGYLALTAAFALLANWLRVLTVIYAGHVSHMRHYLVAREHISFGWLVFACLLAMVFLLGIRFARANGRNRAVRFEATHRSTATGNWSRPAIIATAALVSLPPLAIASAANTASAGSLARWVWPEMDSGAVLSPQSPGSQWTPLYQGASNRERALYRYGPVQIEVFAARYTSQTEGAELVSFANTLLSSGWTQLSAKPLNRGVQHQPIDEVRLIEAETQTGERWLVAYVYKVDDFVTGSAPLVQVAFGTLSWLHATPSLILATAMRCQDSCARAADLLFVFWNTIGMPLLEQNSRARS